MEDKSYLVSLLCRLRLVPSPLIRVISSDQGHPPLPGMGKRDTGTNGNLCYLYKGKCMPCF